MAQQPKVLAARSDDPVPSLGSTLCKAKILHVVSDLYWHAVAWAHTRTYTLTHSHMVNICRKFSTCTVVYFI